jgi:hypothetical protein
MAAAAPVAAKMLPMLLEIQQQQAPATAARTQPDTISSEQVLSSAASLSRGLLELFHSSVTVAATMPAATAAAAGGKESYD